MDIKLRNAPPNVKERMDFMEGKGKSKNPHKGISVSDTVRLLYSEYQNRKALSERERWDEEENHRVYTGINYGQWPKDVLKEIKDKGIKRDISQFNFVMKKTDGLVGDIVQNGHDIDFLSVDGNNSDTISVFKDLYYFDKELCDWSTELITHYTNGCIKNSWMMMNIDYRYDNKFGNIGLKALVPASTLPDPNWVSNNSGDCKSIFTSTYMDLETIKRTWPNSSDMVQALVDTKSLNQSREHIHNGNSIPRMDLENEYNNTYLVIQYHAMVTESRTQMTAMTPGYGLVQVPPDADDAWYEANLVDPNRVLKEKVDVDIYRVTTFIPDLSVTKSIEDKPGLIQMGRLPFFNWSYNRHNGENIGVVDLLKDPQRYFNKMVARAQEMLVESRNVSVIDPAMFDMDVTSMSELEDKFNTPGAKIMGKEGFSFEVSNGIQEIKSSAYVGNEVNFANEILSITDRITPQSAAMEGIGGERSGILYDLKREQGEVNKTLLRESVRLFLNELAEGYFYAAQSLYGGVYRRFDSQFGEIEINKPLPDGRVLNDITTMPRAKVIVSDSPDSVSRRTNDRLIALETLRVLGNIDPMTASYAVEAIFDSMDNVPKSKRETMKQDQERKRELMRTTEVAQLTQNQTAIMQGQMQIQQMTNPQPQVPPQEGEQPPQEAEQAEPVPEEEVI